MSDRKATKILVGSVVVIMTVALGFGFAQDGGSPVLGAGIGAIAAFTLCAVAVLRPRRRDQSAANVGDGGTTQDDLRQRRNAAAWRFVATLGAIIALWLIVFFVL